MSQTDPQNGSKSHDGSAMLRDLLQHGKRAWSLMADGRVPTSHKLIPAAAVAYLLSPIDLVPELAIFGVGYIDDVAILLLALRWFNRLAGDHIASLESEEETAIDAEYRVGDISDEGRSPSI